jgi:hypothetical protein
MHPNLSVEGLDKMMAEEFVDWFKTAVRNHYLLDLVNLDLTVVMFLLTRHIFYLLQCKSDSDSDEDLWNLANGCSSKVLSYNSYDVNGFRFRSELYEKKKTRLRTVNTGVCLSSFTSNNE